jgi:phage major head subunit gpT-like protein
MSTITRSKKAAFLVEGIKKAYGVAYNESPHNYRKLFPILGSENEREVYREMSGVGLHGEKAEGQASPIDSINQGYETTCINKTFAKALLLTHEALADNLYPRILKAATSMGSSAANTVETICMNMINNGFTDNLGDGVPLFSAAHPLSGSNGTGSNISAAAALSMASLTSMSTTVGKFTDARGNKIDVKPQLLIVPVELAITAEELLFSKLKSGTANNDMNAFGRSTGRIPDGYISTPYITDANFFGIKTNVDGSGYQEREKVGFMEDYKNSEMVREVISYFRGNPVIYDWRSFYGNQGA